MITALVTALILGITFGFLFERRQAEKAWTFERRELLNRIKPETAQHAFPGESFNTPPLDGPEGDEQYWETVSNN